MAEENEFMYRPDLVGFPRLRAALQVAVQSSEEDAIEQGLQYVRAEESGVKLLHDAAEAMGGDLENPQFYAGMLTVMTFFGTYGAGSLVGRATAMPLVNMVLPMIGRLHDNVVKEKGEVIPLGD